MNTEKELYKQKSFFQSSMPSLAASLFFLIMSLYCLLNKKPLLWAVLLLMIGLLFLTFGIGWVKRDMKHILRFVREESVFFHKCSPPLTIAGLLEGLKQEGFAVTAYPFGNYYCQRDIDPKHKVHFFVANNDTPDCPEAEDYSTLFIRTVYETHMAAGRQYLLDLEYGAKLKQKSPEYLQAAREGLMHDKQGFCFGFRLGYDTQDDTLYCADAVTCIIWHKGDRLAIYANELLEKLFLSPAQSKKDK